MPRRRTVSPDQRNLIPSEGPLDEDWWQCNGVFTRPYLRQQFSNNEICPPAPEVEPLYELLKKRWLDNLAGLQRQGEEEPIGVRPAILRFSPEDTHRRLTSNKIAKSQA